MTTSGDTTFNLVINEMIDEAFDLCGIGSEGEAVTADMYSRGRRSANLIVKSWGASEHLWLRTARSVTLLASTASYALTPAPMRIIEVRRRVTADSNDTPLRELSHQDYTAMPNKATDSIPTAFYYDTQNGTLYLWPRPSTTTAAAMTLQLTYLRRIEDFDGSADDLDMPQEWLRTFCYALAVELGIKYDIDPGKLRKLEERAAVLKAQLDSWDTEPASLFLQPEQTWG